MALTRRMLTGIVVALLLTGCATGTGAASPTPTAACPESVWGSTPDGCAPFDPDDAMAENERYRERHPLTDAQLADAALPLETAAATLSPFAQPGATVTQEAVIDALADAGFPPNSIQTLVAERTDGTAVAFGISAEFGGCLFGEVSARGLTIEAGGYINDGGCLPAIGH